MRRYFPKIIPEIILLIVVAVYCFYPHNRIWELNRLDAGIATYYAELSAEGQIPYRDFYYLHMPGRLWVDALRFRIFGVSMAPSVPATIVDLLSKLLCTFAIYLVVKKSANRPLAFLACLGVLPLIHYGSLYQPTWALLFSLLSLLALSSSHWSGSKSSRFCTETFLV